MIRIAQKKDIENLVELFENYRKFYKKESDKKASKSFLEERLSNQDSKIYVSENDKGELMGFVQLYPLFSSTRIKKYWLLNDLYVKNEYRGQGISMLLIEKSKELIKDTNACGMYLETEKNNTIGNNLYVKAGFKLYDKVNFYEWENK